MAEPAPADFRNSAFLLAGVVVLEVARLVEVEVEGGKRLSENKDCSALACSPSAD